MTNSKIGKMKASTIREMRPDELQTRLEELERQLFDLRSQAVTEKLENSNLIGNTRRDVARLKTVLRERQAEGQ